MTDELSADVRAVARIDAVPRILDVLCRTTGMGFAAVARVTDDRWVACAVRDGIAFGLAPGGELDLGSTLCDRVRGRGEPVAIEDAAADPEYRGHPTPARYGFRSYVSVPIRLPGGEVFGTLCAIDPKPAPVKRPETLETFRLFADLIAFHLDAQRRVAAVEAALAAEREASRLREQFIAVLAHDLRNPLGAIRMGAEVLAQLPPGDRADRAKATVDRSVARMTGMIDDVLDFARGRLGGGIPLDLRPTPDLAAVLEQVVAELESASPGRRVVRAFDIPGAVTCDAPRLAQLLSNLLGNALAHGDPAGPVTLTAARGAGALVIAVTNPGPPIPPELAAGVFDPFVQGGLPKGAREGLGLGLYIAAQIARGHGGELTVASAGGLTTFTLRMPA